VVRRASKENLLGVELIRCVTYAAKSTQDLRGSIPAQLLDCQEALDRAGDRLLVAEYSDEAASAFHGDRGPGLADAMHQAELLAREHPTVELWAQHSDRLARGDGRTARHAVEIALWALKRGIRIRTIQDPDTFRDLLYAVVTGQRNHEDSRRKGLASAAGRRRATERGEYIGHKADGYRLAVEVNDDGKVVKRLEMDPERQPVIEMLLRLGLRGKTSGQIARALNDGGWYTNPRKKDSQPQPWRSCGVLVVLHNPRYAGLAATRGEIVGPGHWPAYITPRQHERLQTMIAERWHKRRKYRETETFLLSRIAKCGRCGQSLLCHTGCLREDGTFSRRYICTSHWHDRSKGRCDAVPLDADIIETMFAWSLPHLLHETTDAVELDLGEAFNGHWTEAPEREQIRDAVIRADDDYLDRSIERMVARVAPELALQRRAAAARAQARQVELEQRFEAWVETRGRPYSVETRAETAELNLLVREWFGVVWIHDTLPETVITARRRPPLSGSKPPPPNAVRLPRRDWARASYAVGRRYRRPAAWSDEEIVAALQEWAAEHGRSPNSYEWIAGSPGRPGSLCVRRRFGSWEKALKRAGLKPNARRQHRYWTEQEILEALNAWALRNGRPPRSKDWTRAGNHHPCSRSVYTHFGSFGAAVAAAGIAIY
jgi:DNA invertase Pin-like site-specific DNA recombinase